MEEQRIAIKYSDDLEIENEFLSKDPFNKSWE
jgi:hypothetical protein